MFIERSLTGVESGFFALGSLHVLDQKGVGSLFLIHVHISLVYPTTRDAKRYANAIMQ
jgi:hypothetical protein